MVCQYQWCVAMHWQLHFANIIKEETLVETVEAALFANIIKEKIDVKIVKELLFANIIKEEALVKNVIYLYI